MKQSLLLAAALIAGSAAVHAQPLFPNGEFATDLSGWATFGDVGFGTGGFAVITNSTIAGLDDGIAAPGFNFSGSDPIDSGSLESAAGLAQFALDPDAANGIFAFEGSGLGRTVNLAAGWSIGVDATFLTNDNTGFDYAFIVLGNQLEVISLASQTSAGGSLGYQFTSPEISFVSAPVSADGFYNLFIGVVDAESFSVSSALLLDTVSVIPEPGAFAPLAGLFAAGAALLRRRRA